MSISDDIRPLKIVSQAKVLPRDVDAFFLSLPNASPPETLTPAFTWAQVERQLADLSGSPERAAITAPLVSALRKQARWMPPEMVLRELFCLAWTLMDESFQPGLLPGEETEMP